MSSRVVVAKKSALTAPSAVTLKSVTGTSVVFGITDVDADALVGSYTYDLTSYAGALLYSGETSNREITQVINSRYMGDLKITVVAQPKTDLEYLYTNSIASAAYDFTYGPLNAAPTLEVVNDDSTGYITATVSGIVDSDITDLGDVVLYHKITGANTYTSVAGGAGAAAITKDFVLNALAKNSSYSMYCTVEYNTGSATDTYILESPVITVIPGIATSIAALSTANLSTDKRKLTIDWSASTTAGAPQPTAIYAFLEYDMPNGSGGSYFATIPGSDISSVDYEKAISLPSTVAIDAEIVNAVIVVVSDYGSTTQAF